MKQRILKLSLIAGIILLSGTAQASGKCPISHKSLLTALKSSVLPTGGPSNGGFDFHMWASVVKLDGTVCQVVKSGMELDAQWLGSRAISAQKAYTALAFSKADLALSTGNLWAPTQPGGSLFGLQFSNPVDTFSAYDGSASKYGTKNDALIGRKMGGVNVFGGGLALYNEHGRMIGALGVSGDTSCADHNIAWRIRDALNMDYVPAGVGMLGDDNLNYDLDADGNSLGGFGHPACLPGGPAQAISESFPKAGS